MASTSSSSSSTSLESKEWDAFIVFRGQDINRRGFLKDLCAELDRKHINTFTDEKLDTGKEIEDGLRKKLDESHVKIVIFSEHFSNSSFCLNELVRICTHRNPSEKYVLPVFYEVKTDDVQDLKGNFGKVFFKLVKNCKEKEKDWRQALDKISNIKGLVSQNYKSDYQLINTIVKDVQKKLCELPTIDFDNNNLLAGIDFGINEVKLLLDIESSEISERIIGIWGLPGIGKTTLADKVFNEIRTKFDSHYFVRDVKEELKRQSSSSLRDKIIKNLLELEENVNLGTPNEINPSIKRRLKGRKVLIAFDDVEDSNDLKYLAGECSLYRKGSRIMVTSRDKQVLKDVTSEEFIYEVKELSANDALHVFSSYAFKQNHPKEGFFELSKKVISYAQGLPLALRVLGRHLSTKTNIKEWKSELAKLEEVPHKRIEEVLKRSYDGLDRNGKSIFLDIACFWRGEYRYRVERMLEGCGFFPRSEISNLIDKSLINVTSNNKLDMHDLIQQMGHEVVYKECQQRSGGRSRLWKYKDVSNVLINNVGTEKVEGILLHQVKQEMELNRTVFKKMQNLRFLKVKGSINSGRVIFPNGLEFLPQGLRYLYWSYYPLEYLPEGFLPVNLVELHLPYSHLTRLWNENEKQPLGSLRYMDLKFSKDLINIPDLASVPNLEFLNITSCERLAEISLSPNKSPNLRKLICQHCEMLKIPENIGSLLLLEEIDLRGNGSESLPESIIQLFKLKLLNIRYCWKLQSLPELPKCLEYLDAGSCKSLKLVSSSFLSRERGYCNVNFANSMNLACDAYRKIVEGVFKLHLVKQAATLCIVGVEMPQSMKHKNYGSSLSLSLGKHALIGLSLCVVLSDDYCKDIGSFTYIGCKGDFKDEFGGVFQFIFSWDKPQHYISKSSFHMLNWYKPFNPERRFIEASFQFFIPKSYPPEMEISTIQAIKNERNYSVSENDCNLVCACGVHPIYH